MKTAEHSRLIRRMNEIHESDQAAVLFVLDCGGEMKVNTFGEPAPLADLKNRAVRMLTSSVQRKGVENA